ncbi:MAG: sulfite exporter TauE/SafE family protein [Firmicutes bacterium]|nr:sulfite exporter TauE/SafE family protein [Bacillota bacterium]
MILLFWLFITGFTSGIIGTMVGVGGGFIAVPIMTLLLGLSPQLTVGTSLTMSFFNAASSSVMLLRQRRVDLATGWKFALATFPGAIIGSKLASLFSDRSFHITFGLLLLVISVLMWLRKESGSKAPERPETKRKNGWRSWGMVERVIVDSNGLEYRYRFNLYLGIFFSFFIGFLSSIMGIGGGVIHVPLLVLALNFPPHLAAATSLFILTWSALVGATTHFYLGHTYLPYAAALALGGLLGAQIGVRTASALHGNVIVRVFAVVNLLVGMRLIWG